MGIIRNSANRKIKGRVGDMSYYVSKGIQIARQALNNSNYGETARRTKSQQLRRVRWSNLVAFYKVSKSWIYKAFESKTKGQTDYNKFMSVNLSMSRIALTKSMANVDACVVDAFIISQGSLPSINIAKNVNTWSTDVKLGNLTIDDQTTVGTFSLAVLANNPTFAAGDQLSFISYQQSLDAQEMPRVICTAYEVTLDTESNDNLRDYLPSFCSHNDAENNLCTGDDISIGGFAYVQSRNLFGGGLLVSTQRLIVNNSELIALYSSDAMLEDAIASYGVDKDTFLDTGSLPISAAAQPFYITSVTNGNETIPAGEWFRWQILDLRTAGLKVVLSTKSNKVVSSVILLPAESDGKVRDTEASFSTGFSHVLGSNIVTLGPSIFNGLYDTDSVYRITIIFEDDTTVSATFLVGEQTHE